MNTQGLRRRVSETVTGGLARPEGPGNKRWYNRVTIITQKKRIKSEMRLPGKDRPKYYLCIK